MFKVNNNDLYNIIKKIEELINETTKNKSIDLFLLLIQLLKFKT
jgi:hypothetical protein